MEKQKTVLFVMPRLPFPPTSGRKTSLYHYCRILSEELGHKLVVAAFLESGDDPTLKPAFVDELVILHKPGSIEKICGIIKNSFLLKRKPMQVSLFWSQKAKKQIEELIDKNKPDIVMADMVRTTEYIIDAPAIRIADLDDRISLRYSRQLETDIDGINPYGAYLGSIPKALQKIMLWKPVKTAVVKNEIELLHKYELEVGRQCESTIFVAQGEADVFNKELREDKACAVPIGVDIDYFSQTPLECASEEYIGFLGAMNVAHNENAAEHFAKDILPLINKSHPQAKFLIIGGGAQERLLRMQSENVIFTGRVNDVRDYLKKCKVFVCPMTFGSGIKTKNLEAMAMGLPLVTTSIGAENIDARDGVDWYVADDDVTFADRVVTLLENDKHRTDMGQNGKQFIDDNFTWKVAEHDFKQLFHKLQ